MKYLFMRLIKKIILKRRNVTIGKKAYFGGSTSSLEGYNKIDDFSCLNGSMGYGSYIGKNSYLNATIGRFCCISERVNTASGTHPSSDFVSVHPAFYSTKKQCGMSFTNTDCFKEKLLNPVDNKTAVYIGNDVWIGVDVTLIGGIVIGDGAIIAAGSVVTKDVEPYTIVGGVPAKPIKKRFTDEQIKFLSETRWWEADIQWIKEHHEDFVDIERFMERYGK